MRKNRFLAGVLTAAMVVGGLTLPENISISGFGFGALFAQAADEVASGTCGEDLTWVLDDDGVLTISGTGEMDWEMDSSPWESSRTSIVSVVIESGVTNINSNAFAGYTSLTEVEIPNTVTEIEFNAFYGCESLTSIDIPNSVTEIASFAFSGCSSLTSVEIPDGVTSIGQWLFADCSSLTSVYIPNSVTDIGMFAFSGCTSLENVYYIGTEDEWEDINIDMENGNLTNATLNFYLGGGTCGDDLTWVLSEDGVLTISGTGEMYDYSSAYPYTAPWYSNSSSIVSVVVEEGVTSIGNNAFAVFYGNLVSVDIPDSLTSIGEYAFYWCDNLTEININDNITEIGVYAFYGCDGLADDNGFVVIRDELICYCGDALEIEIPSNVVTIAVDAFVENTITSVVISEGVEEIGDRAFEYARLENVEISNTVTTIGALAFYGCESLTSVTIPSSVTSIGGSAFGYYLGENGGDKVEGFTIYGYSGTAAEAYAEENGFTFIDLDGTSTAAVTLGDANGDDEINYLDAMAVLRYDAELMEMTAVQLAAADVNDDGNVNSLDAILILRYDAGLIASFAE